MSKLMWIAGILLVAAGLALGLMVLASEGPVDSLGIRLETAAILLVGGIVSLGLGSVIDALQHQRAAPQARAAAGVAAAPAPEAAIPEFGRKTAEAAGAAAAAAAAQEAEVSEPTRETLKALEQARQKIEQAIQPGEKAEQAAPPMAEAPAPAPEEEMAENQLYVVEERFIRMRPARILSDGTVEAETEEGWMRFENLEHLDEYLDAMEPAKG